MKNKLKEFCRSIGIEYIGVAPPGPYPALAEILKDKQAKGHYTEFEEQNLERRMNPRLTMPDVQSIIVCLFPYFTGRTKNSNVAKYSAGLDYHIIVKDKLEQIGRYLTSRLGGFKYESFTDTGPLADRYLAYLAGLGIYGINGNIINEKYGSYVVIGYLLTNYPFEPDKPLDTTCIKCGRCIRDCPGQAILGDCTIDPRRCRSYLTQKKGELTEQEVKIIKKSGTVFGCDICQDVCPHNKNAAISAMKEFTTDAVYNLNYDELASMSNREFKQRYGRHAFSWRGKKTLLRNIKYIQDD